MFQSLTKGKDADEYDLEILDRFESDEILDSSAITLDDSTEYFTLIEGSTVYGGGGVIPDSSFQWIQVVPFTRVFLRDASYSYFLQTVMDHENSGVTGRMPSSQIVHGRYYRFGCSYNEEPF